MLDGMACVLDLWVLDEEEEEEEAPDICSRRTCEASTTLRPSSRCAQAVFLSFSSGLIVHVEKTKRPPGLRALKA